MTFTERLNDLKWLFAERGMQNVWNLLKHFASGTTQGTFVAGAGMIGAIEMDASSNPGLTAAVQNTVNASGQLNLVSSTKLPFDDNAVPKTPPTQFASS